MKYHSSYLLGVAATRANGQSKLGVCLVVQEWRVAQSSPLSIVETDALLNDGERGVEHGHSCSPEGTANAWFNCEMISKLSPESDLTSVGCLSSSDAVQRLMVLHESIAREQQALMILDVHHLESATCM